MAETASLDINVSKTRETIIHEHKPDYVQTLKVKGKRRNF